MSLPVASGQPARPAAITDTPPGRDGPDTHVLRPDDLHFDDPPPAARRSTFPAVDGYDISEVIGAGAMGIVLKARHRRLNRTVALKILGRDALADPESHERFQLEAEAVARLQHPNIIQVFDVGAFADGTGDCPYLALEYVGGGSLYRHTLTPQNPRQAAELVEKLARAVAAAHRVGVVHRDLKPANVLLTPDGEPKIADFGLAKQMEPGRDTRGRFLTQLGAAVGTPEYMAPEQVDGSSVAPAMDVYALGVILYELLTARVPFKGETITETMLMVKYEEPVSPRRLQPNLPRDLETICLKCLAKAPAGRYPTAEGLADDLARWLAGRPIHARPAGRVERVERWAKRNPTVAALSALAVLLALAGVGGVTWKWREAETKAREAEDRRQAEQWELYRGCLAFVSADLRLNTLTTTRDTLLRAP
jgi:serine/threonine protein kinase